MKGNFQVRFLRHYPTSGAIRCSRGSSEASEACVYIRASVRCASGFVHDGLLGSGEMGDNRLWQTHRSFGYVTAGTQR